MILDHFLPKTEKELELYFKLKDLEGLRQRRHIKPYGIGSANVPLDQNEQEYQKAKQEYLKLANETL